MTPLITHILTFIAGYCLGMVITLALCLRRSNKDQEP